ncbi:MAG: HD-GYP domain-containing protein [Thioalkalivibrio sp.]
MDKTDQRESARMLRMLVDDLKKGMYVCQLDRPWLDSPFLLQGFPIHSDRELEVLRQLCVYVFIDPERGHGAQARTPSKPSPSSLPKLEVRESPALLTPPPTEPARFRQQMGRAARVRDRSHDYVRRTMEKVQLGHGVDTDEAREMVSALVEQVVEGPSAMVWMTQLRKRDAYTSIHSVNVCILALTFGRYMGLDTSLLNTLGLGALLHDIGKLRVPLEILNKPGALSPKEFELMKTHPVEGHRLLLEDPNVPPAALDAVLHHHERNDGRGYPDGLGEGQIPVMTQMVSIVDIYDALCSHRAYHDGISAQEALSRLYNMAGTGLDRELIQAFIRCVGIYPIGAVVELTTGQVAVIVGLNENQKLRPVVMLLREADQHTPCARQLMNLGSDVWRQHKDAPAVRRMLDPDELHLDMAGLIREQLSRDNSRPHAPADLEEFNQ